MRNQGTFEMKPLADENGLRKKLNEPDAQWGNHWRRQCKRTRWEIEEVLEGWKIA